MTEKDLATDVRSYVELLANQPLGVSMTEWNIISNTFLKAADALNEIETYRTALAFYGDPEPSQETGI